MSTRYSRREFLQHSMTSMAAAGLTEHLVSDTVRAASSPSPRPRPNVVLYVVDDQGSTDAGCYGNPVIRTPGLDALAAQGTRFTHAFCTAATCSASRAVILSGLHNHANGQYGHAHSYHHFASFDRVQSLPNMLSQAGYRTARWGKYHVAPEHVYAFDRMLGAGHPRDGADQCRDFIATDDTSPFFLYFCTTEPHRPFRRDRDTFSPDQVIVPSYLPDSPECREELAHYYDSVERADSGLVRLIEILKQSGHWEDTVVIYLSDNGIAFPGAKTNLYDPGMRLPCVVRNPSARQQGVVTDAMISYTDITPTILDLCQAHPAGYTFQGRSFASLLETPHVPTWDTVYASHTFHEITMYYPMRVIRTRRYKLIWNIAWGLEFPFASDLHAASTWQAVQRRAEPVYGKRKVKDYLHRPAFELYDLQQDPDEINNLADSPSHAALLVDLKGRLKTFQTRTNDPWVIKWEYE